MKLVPESINACEYDIQSFEAEAIYADIAGFYFSLSLISITLGRAHLPPHTMALTFIKSEKGKRKLCDEENYVYEKHQDNLTKTKIYWRCELFYAGCKASIHTPYNCDKPTSVFCSGSHTHPASCAKVEARIAVNSMQNINTLFRTIQNWRRTAVGYSALPAFCCTTKRSPRTNKIVTRPKRR